MNPNNEKIEARAYRLSQERIGKGSAPLDDWLRAEFEMKNCFGTELENDEIKSQELPL